MDFYGNDLYEQAESRRRQPGLYRDPKQFFAPMLFNARKLTVAALLAEAMGFVIQMISGFTDTPTIPPGLVVILVAAGLVSFAPGGTLNYNCRRRKCSGCPQCGPKDGRTSFR